MLANVRLILDFRGLAGTRLGTVGHSDSKAVAIVGPASQSPPESFDTSAVG